MGTGPGNEGLRIGHCEILQRVEGFRERQEKRATICVVKSELIP